MFAFEKKAERINGLLDLLDRPRPETWAASPVDLYGSEEVRNMQLTVGIEFEKRCGNASKALDLPREIAEYLHITVLQRFHYETQENNCSFSDRLYDLSSDVPEELLIAHEHSMVGTALPGELLDTQEVLGMRSVELAKVSHIGGQKMELLSVARKAVEDTLVERGGELYENDEKSLRLVSGDSLMLDSDERPSLSALTMTRKRRIGVLPNGTEIREKSQFILRIDEASMFDQDIADRIRSIKIEDGETWRGKVLEIDGFEAAVFAMLEEDSYETAVPLSTTIYAHNIVTDYRIAERKKRKDTGRTVFIRDTDDTARLLANGPIENKA